MNNLSALETILLRQDNGKIIIDTHAIAYNKNNIPGELNFIVPRAGPISITVYARTQEEDYHFKKPDNPVVCNIIAYLNKTEKCDITTFQFYSTVVGTNFIKDKMGNIKIFNPGDIVQVLSNFDYQKTPLNIILQAQILSNESVQFPPLEDKIPNFNMEDEIYTFLGPKDTPLKFKLQFNGKDIEISCKAGDTINLTKLKEALK